MDKKGVLKALNNLESQIMGNKSAIDEEQNSLTELSQIILRIDSYEDIYSDFDPRPHSKRALSDDFLIEAQKASRDKTGNQIELRFLLPKAVKNTEEENTVKRRLHEHFKRHFSILTEEIKSIKLKGSLQAVLGAFMLIASAYFSNILADSFKAHMLNALLEPAGWFTAWSGLDQVFYSSYDKKQQRDFYDKMHRSKIVFSYH